MFDHILDRRAMMTAAVHCLRAGETRNDVYHSVTKWAAINKTDRYQLWVDIQLMNEYRTEVH